MICCRTPLSFLRKRGLRSPGPLSDSLDAKVDDDVEAAWDAEIARRIRDVDAGKVALIPWSEVRRRLIGQ